MLIRSAALRRALRVAIPFALIPALVAAGAFIFREKSYSFVSLCVAALSLLLFASGYERKKTGARRLVLVSVMTALSVAGRFIPLLKPVTALTILTALYLGGESGFLVGALSALISNVFFGQGPWTPFQMLAWGLIGLAAGALAKPLKRNRALLLLFGLLSGAAFSLIMDVWTVLWYNGSFSPRLYAAALLTALPHMALYAASNAAFLALLAKPFGEKLERMHVKYGV